MTRNDAVTRNDVANDASLANDDTRLAVHRLTLADSFVAFAQRFSGTQGIPVKEENLRRRVVSASPPLRAVARFS
eukprot:2674113-Pleurochrysis_carterae.AAC.1